MRGDLLHRLGKIQLARGVDCRYVLPTRDNNTSTSTQRGFKTLWQKSVTLTLKEKVIEPEGRFIFRDLRA